MSVSDADYREKLFGQKPWPTLDPRLPIIAQMASVIFCEKLVYNDDPDARRFAVTQAFLLYGEIAIRLAENDR